MGKGSRKKTPPRKRVQAANVSTRNRQARGEVDSGQRPSEWRRRRGVWADPTGSAKSTQPTVDLAADMIGALHCAKRITDAQEQAARTFQQARRAYIAELPDVAGYKSCISTSVPGYDDSDGDAQVIAAYRSIERLLTMRERSEVLRVCEDNDKPSRLETLHNALDKIGG